MILNGRSTSDAYLSAKYKFTGKERDVETGYDYFGARYYDSRIGRWLQVDRLSDNYRGWSPYNYSLDNPIMHIDPNGLGVWRYDVPKDRDYILGDDDKQKKTINYLSTVASYVEEGAQIIRGKISEAVTETGKTIQKGSEELSQVVLNEGPTFLNDVSATVTEAGIIAGIGITATGNPEIGAAVVESAVTTSTKIDMLATGLSILNYALDSTPGNYQKVNYQLQNLTIGWGVGAGAMNFVRHTGELIRYGGELLKYSVPLIAP